MVTHYWIGYTNSYRSQIFEFAKHKKVHKIFLTGGISTRLGFNKQTKKLKVKLKVHHVKFKYLFMCV